ncbi:hypothetical protein [Burkholderia cenocepacia]|uniref:hypothetical protein n=1 Tax=Burkholderia cenocepacia TaxID=95486 RepID=UPI0015C58309|nr:hypothetical protein [Burkholderia cenocepacia]
MIIAINITSLILIFNTFLWIAAYIKMYDDEKKISELEAENTKLKNEKENNAVAE